MKHYKIQDKNTNLFSSGNGARKCTSKKGKIWTNLGHVKTHLRGTFIHDNGYGRNPRYKNCIPEEYIVLEYVFPDNFTEEEATINKIEARSLYPEQFNDVGYEDRLKKAEEEKIQNRKFSYDEVIQIAKLAFKEGQKSYGGLLVHPYEFEDFKKSETFKNLIK